MTKDSVASDLYALSAFVKRHPDADEISRILTVNGPVPFEKQSDYVAMVERLIAEVTVWLTDKAPRPILKMAGLRTA